MVRGLVLLLGCATVVGLAGCNTDPGPNDPVVSGSEINESRNSRMSEEERERMAGLSRDAAVPGGGQR
jgi:hypothetical protein